MAPLRCWWSYLGFQLSAKNNTIGLLNDDNAGLTLEKDQLILDLEKMRFSYDTLETENSMMVAELAAQQERIDGLLTKVKNGYWEVAKLKKEAETLRSIMKGYIGTIDSLNQLNMALLDENFAMKEQMEAVSQENADLVERQENMEDMLEAGQTLQVAEFLPTGVRMLSSGRQRDTDRADRSDMLRVCFTILENRIAPVGDKTLHLKITDSEGNVLPNEDGNTEFSASRTMDYARERLDACMFYDHPDEPPKSPTDPAPTSSRSSKERTVIGTTDLVVALTAPSAPPVVRINSSFAFLKSFDRMSVVSNVAPWFWKVAPGPAARGRPCRAHMEDLGHHVLARNWRWHRHEIDVISMHRDTLMFHEVKCRSGCATAIDRWDVAQWRPSAGTTATDCASRPCLRSAARGPAGRCPV